MPNKLSQFWQELKRRKVTRVITIYAAAAFVILQLVEILAPSLRLPEWTMNFILVLLIVGFTITVIVSWIYDIHPEGGIVRTEPAHKVKAEEKPVSSSGWKIASYISFVVIVGLIILNVIPRGQLSDEFYNLEKSIAVLPFQNMSSSNDFDYFGDAMTDEIIMQLYKINEFIVRSRTSVMQYKSTEKTSPEIGQELKANYLLEGSAQRFEDQVRILVQLIRAETDEHIWGEVYEGKWQELFELQSEIARNIAVALKTVLTPEEIQSINTEPTRNFDAYDYYLQGNIEHWKYFQDHDPSHIHKSIEFYLRAIELDSEYSLAYTGMGREYWMLGHYALNPSQDHWNESKRLLQKAIELDPDNGWAYAELGVVQHNWDWDSTAARKSFDKAMQLSPNNDNCYIHFIHFESRLRNCSRLKKLIEEFAETLAVEIDEGNIWHLMWLECQNDSKEIVRIGDQYWNATSSMNPTIHYYLANIEEGHIEKATEIAENIIRRTTDPSIQLMLKGYHMAVIGELEDANTIIEDLHKLSESRFVSKVFFANIYYALGDRELTQKYMELALLEHDWRIHAFLCHTSMNLIKREPWFKDLIDRSWIPLNE